MALGTRREGRARGPERGPAGRARGPSSGRCATDAGAEGARGGHGGCPSSGERRKRCCTIQGPRGRCRKERDPTCRTSGEGAAARARASGRWGRVGPRARVGGAGLRRALETAAARPGGQARRAAIAAAAPRDEDATAPQPGRRGRRLLGLSSHPPARPPAVSHALRHDSISNLYTQLPNTSWVSEALAEKNQLLKMALTGLARLVYMSNDASTFSLDSHVLENEKAKLLPLPLLLFQRNRKKGPCVSTR